MSTPAPPHSKEMKQKSRVREHPQTRGREGGSIPLDTNSVSCLSPHTHAKRNGDARPLSSLSLGRVGVRIPPPRSRHSSQDMTPISRHSAGLTCNDHRPGSSSSLGIEPLSEPDQNNATAPLRMPLAWSRTEPRLNSLWGKGRRVNRGGPPRLLACTQPCGDQLAFSLGDLAAQIPPSPSRPPQLLPPPPLLPCLPPRSRLRSLLCHCLSRSPSLGKWRRFPPSLPPAARGSPEQPGRGRVTRTKPNSRHFAYGLYRRWGAREGKALLRVHFAKPERRGEGHSGAAGGVGLNKSSAAEKPAAKRDGRGKSSATARRRRSCLGVGRAGGGGCLGWR